jgi:hypothetical protein
VGNAIGAAQDSADLLQTPVQCVGQEHPNLEMLMEEVVIIKIVEAIAR